MPLQISVRAGLLCMLALVMASLHVNTSAASRITTPAAPPAHRFSYPSTLKYYVHAVLNSTAYPVQPINPAATATFGQMAVFSYKVTLNPDINSTQVGSIRGLEVYNSINPSTDATILVLNTVTYNDGAHDGTISLHGQGNINLTNYELTVVGGTADFRGVAGYAAITNLRTPGSDHVFEHMLHFLS